MTGVFITGNNEQMNASHHWPETEAAVCHLSMFSHHFVEG
jgi:hypothetical protein